MTIKTKIANRLVDQVHFEVTNKIFIVIFKILFLLSLLFCGLHLRAQLGFMHAGIEFQAYPTGLIPGVRVEKTFAKNAFHLRLGYNWIRHGSNGKHDDERGQGGGFTLGYRRYLKSPGTSYFLGIRNDVWFNSIDWTDELPGGGERKGNTKITVLQPTMEAGYAWSIGESYLLAPTISFGYEVNIKTEGEPTGEGPILLLGVQLSRRIN